MPFKPNVGNYETAQRTLSSHFKPTSEKFCHAWVCAYTHSQMTDEWMCVVPTHNDTGSKQTSFRIMTMEKYRTLKKANHNTANTRHLILALSMWQRCHCGKRSHIWPISTKTGVNRQITIKPPLTNLTRIRPMQATVIYVDRWTESQDEGSRIFRCLYERA